MGVDCVVKVLTGLDGTIKAGNVLTGKLIYTIKEESTFSKVTVSLKGNGFIFIKEKQRGNKKTHRKRESYVDIDYIIYKTENGEITPKGTYMKEFNFILPEDIPPSLRITKKLPKHLVHVSIIYYVKIKFEGSGLVTRVYKFKRLVNVSSLVKPRLPIDPSTHGDQWKLPQISWKENVVKLKAMIDKCVKMPGDKIKIDYEIMNDTNFAIKEVIVKILEVHTFKAGTAEVKIGEDVNKTESRTGLIVQGNVQHRTSEIDLPKILRSIEYSNLIAREYFISITLELPKHRENIVFEIPIQITDDRPPPSYWEVLQELDENNSYQEEQSIVDDVQSISSYNNNSRSVTSL